MNRWSKNYEARILKCPICGATNYIAGSRLGRRKNGHRKDLTCAVCGNDVQMIERSHYGTKTMSGEIIFNQ